MQSQSEISTMLNKIAIELDKQGATYKHRDRQGCNKLLRYRDEDYYGAVKWSKKQVNRALEIIDRNKNLLQTH